MRSEGRWFRCHPGVRLWKLTGHPISRCILVFPRYSTGLANECEIRNSRNKRWAAPQFYAHIFLSNGGEMDRLAVAFGLDYVQR